MNELRWILLAAGIVLIAGIWYWGARRREPSAAAMHRPLPPAGEGETPSLGAARRPLPQADEAGPAPVAVRRTLPQGADVQPSAGAAHRPLPQAGEGGHRFEPSVALDDDFDSKPAIERRAEFREAPPLRAPSETATAGRREPTLGAGLASATPAPLEPALEPAPRTAPAATPVEPAAPARKRPPQKIFAVRVSAQGQTRLPGERVRDALQAEGLRFGRYDIFHRLHDDGRPIFSVASLRDPGTFDLAEMPVTQYPGVLVFTVLPGPVAAGEAFDEMLFTARALATHLGGGLADDKGVPVTAQRVAQLREEVLEFERAAAGVA